MQLTNVLGRSSKKFKLHASQTASESSTIAEEIVVLLRRLHPLPAWNPLINHYISSSLQTIPSLIVQTSGEASSIKTQVCGYDIQPLFFSYTGYIRTSLVPRPFQLSKLHAAYLLVTLKSYEGLGMRLGTVYTYHFDAVTDS